MHTGWNFTKPLPQNWSKHRMKRATKCIRVKYTLISFAYVERSAWMRSLPSLTGVWTAVGWRRWSSDRVRTRCRDSDQCRRVARAELTALRSWRTRDLLPQTHPHRLHNDGQHRHPPTVQYVCMQGRRNGSGRPGGCRTNNLTSNKNFYVHIISIFENVCWF